MKVKLQRSMDLGALTVRRKAKAPETVFVSGCPDVDTRASEDFPRDKVAPSCEIPTALSQYLDLARWASAAFVLVTHVNNRMFLQSIGVVSDKNLAQKLWIFICGFGHQGVVMFFVLSGFLVGGKLIRDMRSGTFQAPIYFADRISRIHTVLIPVLVATLLLDWAGGALAPQIYPGPPNYAPVTLLGNLLVLQDFGVPVLGSNGPLGTLSNEFWYYLLFPLMFAPLHPRFGRFAWLALVAGVAGTLFLGAFRVWHLVGALLWLIGAIAAVLPVAARRRGMFAVAAFLAVLLAERLFIRATAPLTVHTIADLLLGTAFATSAWALRTGSRWKLPTRLAATNHLLSNFSYSLYALHVPVIMVFIAFCTTLTGFGWHSRVDTAPEWAAVGVCLLLALAAAYLLSRATEVRTPVVRAVLRRQFIKFWPQGNGIFMTPRSK